MATFSDRLNILRKEKGITLDALAKELETTKSTLSRYENNLREPKAEFVNKLASFFNCSVDYLLGKTDIPNTEHKEPELTTKDHKEIETILSDTEKALLSQEGLMFNGEPASEETRRKIIDAMRIGMEMAKKEAKEKYTPKKYKKGD